MAPWRRWEPRMEAKRKEGMKDVGVEAVRVVVLKSVRACV
jgi:hypothetical protein